MRSNYSSPLKRGACEKFAGSFSFRKNYIGIDEKHGNYIQIRRRYYEGETEDNWQDYLLDILCIRMSGAINLRLDVVVSRYLREAWIQVILRKRVVRNSQLSFLFIIFARKEVVCIGEPANP